jgi:hypothetical protein
MFFIPEDHAALLNAQTEGKLRHVQDLHKVQICIISEGNVAHLWGDNHVAAKEDLLKLVQELKKINNSEKRMVSETDKIETSEPSNNAVEQEDAEIIVVPIPRPPTPEIITLDDDKEETAVPRLSRTIRRPSADTLQVTLLPSEWDFVFPESLSNDGILSRLSKIFEVNIFVSKDDLTATIQDGNAEGRNFAQKNIVYWLECKAGGVGYTIQHKPKGRSNNKNTNGWINCDSNSSKRKSTSPTKKNRSPKRRRLNESVPPPPTPSGNQQRQGKNQKGQNNVSPNNDKKTVNGNNVNSNRGASSNNQGNRGGGGGNNGGRRNNSPNNLNKGFGYDPRQQDYLQVHQIPPPPPDFNFEFGPHNLDLLLIS